MLTVENLGPETAREVQAEDGLPAGSASVSVPASDWSGSEAEGIVTCYRLAFGAGETLNINIRATAPTAIGSTSNSVSVRSTSGDGHVENNVSVLTFDILPVDTEGDGVPDESDNLPCCLLRLPWSTIRP